MEKPSNISFAQATSLPIAGTAAVTAFEKVGNVATFAPTRKISRIIDLLCGLGIVLPTLLRIKPKLTIFAAYGIIVLMTAASIFHISRGEAKDISFNIFMAIIAVFIVWGRERK